MLLSNSEFRWHNVGREDFRQLGGYLSLIEQTSQICIELSSGKTLENNILCSDNYLYGYIFG